MNTLNDILVPMDFSRHSKHALRYVAALAKKTDATVHIIHVLHPDLFEIDFEEGVLEKLAKLEDVPKSVQGEIETELDEAVDIVQKDGVKAVRHTRIGKPHEQILQASSDLQCSVVVMGTHGRGGSTRLGIGHVYSKVMRLSTIPVLAIRDPEQEFIVDDEGNSKLEAVLCPCDLSELSLSAIPYASGFCRLFGAKLVLAHIVHTAREYDSMKPSASARASNPGIQTTRERLMSTAAEYSDIVSEVIVEQGIPVDQLAELVRKHNAGLIVMSTHGRSGIVKGVLGSVTENLFNATTCPFLTVHPASRPSAVASAGIAAGEKG